MDSYGLASMKSEAGETWSRVTPPICRKECRFGGHLECMMAEAGRGRSSYFARDTTSVVKKSTNEPQICGRRQETGLS